LNGWQDIRAIFAQLLRNICGCTVASKLCLGKMSDGKLAGSHARNCCVQQCCHQTKHHGWQHAMHQRWQLNATGDEAWRATARAAQNPLSL
jgi:hypothetical protein